MELLSEDSQRMLDYLIKKSKLNNGDLIICSSGELPEEINRDKTLTELSDKDYCFDIVKMGRNGFKCRFKEYKANEYQEQKPKLLREKEKMMFNKLPAYFEDFLSDLLIHKDNLSEYVYSLYRDGNDEKKTELNQIFTVLKEKKLINCVFADDRVYRIDILLSGNHYFEFKQELFDEKPKNSTPNIITNINGGTNQFNTANDHAIINATQTNGINTDELNKLLDAVRAEIPDNISKDYKETINDSLDVISSELLSDSPNEKNVKCQFKLLSKIDCGVKFLSALGSVLTFANQIYPFLGEVVPFYKGLIG